MGVKIVGPKEVVPANPVIVGELCPDDITSTWHIIAHDQHRNYLTIDLSQEGDTLRICLDEKDHDRRPTAVASKSDSGLTLAVFQRGGAREPAGRQRRTPKAIRSSEN